MYKCTLYTNQSLYLYTFEEPRNRFRLRRLEESIPGRTGSVSWFADVLCALSLHAEFYYVILLYCNYFFGRIFFRKIHYSVMGTSMHYYCVCFYNFNAICGMNRSAVWKSSCQSLCICCGWNSIAAPNSMFKSLICISIMGLWYCMALQWNPSNLTP